jgi:hypothetical protein
MLSLQESLQIQLVIKKVVTYFGLNFTTKLPDFWRILYCNEYVHVADKDSAGSQSPKGCFGMSTPACPVTVELGRASGRRHSYIGLEFTWRDEADQTASVI